MRVGFDGSLGIAVPVSARRVTYKDHNKNVRACRNHKLMYRKKDRCKVEGDVRIVIKKSLTVHCVVVTDSAVCGGLSVKRRSFVAGAKTKRFSRVILAFRFPPRLFGTKLESTDVDTVGRVNS